MIFHIGWRAGCILALEGHIILPTVVRFKAIVEQVSSRCRAGGSFQVGDDEMLWLLREQRWRLPG
ncbi:MAG: hypothetical protein DMG40_11775 [Acidobacteria bacterium]|nr:MAG: hypothetical protein DMG40_11775 [Acidobacteriota bacterium]